MSVFFRDDSPTRGPGLEQWVWPRSLGCEDADGPGPRRSRARPDCRPCLSENQIGFRIITLDRRVRQPINTCLTQHHIAVDYGSVDDSGLAAIGLSEPRLQLRYSDVQRQMLEEKFTKAQAIARWTELVDQLATLSN